MPRSALPSALAALLLAACGHAPVAPERPPPDLAVSRVILYQNGVGYFERRGRVDADRVELRVRPDQINDVLKSLTVLDLAGGVASAVSLPVERTADSLAAELPPQVRSAAGLQGLLPVLRGAPVVLETTQGTLSGRVVGVESGSVGDKQEPLLTLMTDGSQLVTTPVSAVRRLVIGDGALSAGLDRSLDISRGEGAWKPVTLTLHLAGSDRHDVVVSYIHEVPVWRPAYRAWIESGRKVRLQGWAVVDNVSGEPWKDVKLTLAVGSPLSFRYDLHTPHGVRRPDLSARLPQVADAPPPPDVGYEEERAQAPTYADLAPAAPMPAAPMGGMPAPAPMAPRRSAAKSAAPRYDAQESRKGEAYSDDADARRDALARSAAALVTGREVGALYTYEATAPVTVPDRAAALVNIVNREVEGEDVFLFREPHSNAPPFRALLLRNGKDAALEAGPLTLYVDGTFAGEGFVGRVGRDETAFVPYAREGGFAVNLVADSRVDSMRLAKVVDGKVTLQGRRVHTKKVSLQSNRDQDAKAYVKLALTPGTELVDPPADLVRAGADVYLPVRVAAKGKAEAQLVETTPLEVVEAGLTDRVLEAFRFFVTGKGVEEAVAGPVRELLRNHDEILRVRADTKRLEEQRDVYTRENDRVQGSLYALPNNAAAASLRKQLMAQMEQLATDSAEVARKLVENGIKLAALTEKEIQLLRQISLK